MKKPKKEAGSWKTELLLAALCFAVFIFIFLLINGNNFITPLDKSIESFFLSHFSLPAVLFFRVLTNILSVYNLAVFSILLGIYFYLDKQSKKGTLLIGSMSLGLIITELTQLATQRIRPFPNLIDVTGFSFPSGHTISAAIFFLAILFLFKDNLKSKASKYIFLSITLLIILAASFARIYLNAHWFSDVIGSLFLGTSIILLVDVLLKRV